jgi:hypothetical protein
MTPETKRQVDEVKGLLKDRMLEVCSKLYPGGHVEGRLFVTNTPEDARGQLPALKVALRGDKGAWKNYRDGAKGDCLRLIEYALACDFKDAMNWARDFLGLRNMSADERQKLRAQSENRARDEARRSEKNRAFKLKRAGEIFLEGDELGCGTVAEAHAMDYFRARACPLEMVQNLNPMTFRFGDATEWWKGAEWTSEDRNRFKQKEGPRFPAIHSAMRVKTGIVTCCHVTFLDPVRPAKAPVTPAKLMFGEATGAVIEISMGPEGKPFWRALTPHPLIIAEGIETAATLAIAAPEARVWAAGSLNGFGSAPVGLGCISDITVARDNNVGNAQAQKQLNAGLIKLAEFNKPLTVIASHVGDDFNDLA